MITLIKSYSRKEEGFTLIELLVVILVIGILAAISVPVFLNQRKVANEAAVKSDLTNAAKVFETEFIANKGKTYPTTIPSSVKTSVGVTLSLPEGTTTDPSLSIPFTAKDGYSLNPKFSQNNIFFYVSIPVTDQIRNMSIKYKYNCSTSSGTIEKAYSTGFNTKTTGPTDIFLTLGCGAGNTLIQGTTVLFAETDQVYANLTQLRAIPGEYPLPNSKAADSSDKGFCINGTHSNIGGKTFKYDSSSGGLQEGTC